MTDKAPPQAMGAAAATRAAELAAIERLHAADVRAVLAGDTAALMSLWTDDIVALPPGGPITVGRARNAESLRRSMEQSRDLEPLEYVLDFASVELLGDHALEWGTYRGRARPRAGGAAVSYGGKVMRLLRRQPDGSWLVARTMFTAEE
jgi:ketosteroid isomerase-like protein